MPLSILVAVANRPELRDELADQLTADRHDVHQAHHSRHAAALLATRHIDVLILRALEHPAAAPALLRKLRAGTLDPRAWPALPTLTLAPLVGDGELDAPISTSARSTSGSCAAISAASALVGSGRSAPGNRRTCSSPSMQRPCQAPGAAQR